MFEEPGVDDGSDKNKSKGRIMAKGEDKGHRFGVCVLDCATSQFNLSAFEDDVCRTKLETLMRQIRPKEVLFKKVESFMVHSRGVPSNYFLRVRCRPLRRGFSRWPFPVDACGQVSDL